MCLSSSLIYFAAILNVATFESVWSLLFLYTNFVKLLLNPLYRFLFMSIQNNYFILVCLICDTIVWDSSASYMF